jgi:hypothetical protein
MLKLDIELVVGIPDSTPLELSVKTAGRVPRVKDQTYGAAPGGSYTALVMNWTLYSVPARPDGSGDAFVICGAGLQYRVNPVRVTVMEALSVTSIVTSEELAVQFPTIWLLEFRLRPNGSRAALNVYGDNPPVADSCTK